MFIIVVKYSVTQVTHIYKLPLIAEKLHKKDLKD